MPSPPVACSSVRDGDLLLKMEVEGVPPARTKNGWIASAWMRFSKGRGRGFLNLKARLIPMKWFLGGVEEFPSRFEETGWRDVSLLDGQPKG